MGELSKKEKQNLDVIKTIVYETLEHLQIERRNKFEIKFDSVPDKEQKRFYRKEIKKTTKKLLQFNEELLDPISGSIREFRNYYSFCVLKKGEFEESHYSYLKEIEENWKDIFITNFVLGLYDEKDELVYLNKDFEDFDLSFENSWEWTDNPEEYFSLPFLNELIECIETVEYFKMVFDFYHLSSNNSLNIDKHYNKTITGLDTFLDEGQIKLIYKLLKPKFIPENTHIEHFKAVFSGEKIPLEYSNHKIKWNKTIPLFCCLLFGYENLDFNNESISFKGIVDKQNSAHFYKKALSIFSFGNRKVTNKTLSEKTSKLTLSIAPAGFKDIYEIIKTVQNITV